MRRLCDLAVLCLNILHWNLDRFRNRVCPALRSYCLHMMVACELSLMHAGSDDIYLGLLMVLGHFKQFGVNLLWHFHHESIYQENGSAASQSCRA